VSKKPFFAEFFSENILKNHNIGPSLETLQKPFTTLIQRSAYFFQAAMSDRESRVLSMVQDSYHSSSPEDLRQMEDVLRIKQEIEHRHLAYAYRPKGIRALF
jgi:hypothetical protein